MPKGVAIRSTLTATMARYQVILAYQGTRYYGFQRLGRRATPDSAPGQGRAIQEAVEAALRQLGWQGRSILAAGRTDRGVHAAGQVVAFDLDWSHAPEKLQAALNALLPPDIAVRSLAAARPDFHPRFDARARHYRYRIYCTAARHPLREQYAWRVWPPPDLERLQSAARCLVGTHDFAAFGTPPRAGGSTWRTVLSAEWQPELDWLDAGMEQDRLLRFDIVANAFLQRMVRRLVSIQVEIAQGRQAEDRLTGYLANPPQKVIQGLAPPQGLILMQVLYPPEGGSKEQARTNW